MERCQYGGDEVRRSDLSASGWSCSELRGDRSNEFERLQRTARDDNDNDVLEMDGGDVQVFYEWCLSDAARENSWSYGLK